MLFLTMTNLKKRRERLKLTQSRVAMLAGITDRTLTAHETGKGRRCPYPARESLARVLGCNVSFLFDANGVAR